MTQVFKVGLLTEKAAILLNSAACDFELIFSASEDD